MRAKANTTYKNLFRQIYLLFAKYTNMTVSFEHFFTYQQQINDTECNNLKPLISHGVISTQGK